MAIIKSATAKLIKNGRRSVLDLRPRAKTRTTKTLPTIDNSIVNVKRTARPACESSEKSLVESVSLSVPLTYVTFNKV